VQLTLDDPAAFPWGGEPILMDGRAVGEVTSAGYSRRFGRAVAFGYARSPQPDAALEDAALRSARFAIDIAGTPACATVQAGA
jgi:4-methylaminobutanoate oxidase (formaldehyde-forming)